MNMKRTISMILTLLLFIASATPVYSKGGEEHKKDYKEVLFGTVRNGSPEDEAAAALAAAASLTIDHYKLNNGQKQLDTLKKYGVKNLPSLEAISIDGGGKHRVYAHNGWDSEYHSLRDKQRYSDAQWQKKWKLRKGIIEKTVNAIFDFNWWSGIPVIGEQLPSSSEECDSFCALIYYIHLIGDHVETHSMDEYNLLMPLGGRVLSDTIVSELKYHCEILFENQEDTNEYDHLEDKLREIDTECLNMGDITENNLKKNQELAQELLDELKKDIPILLKEESFFSNAMDQLKKAG